MFKNMEDMVEIHKNDFFNFDKEKIGNVDLLLVDIGNTKKIFQFFVDQVYPLMKRGSISLLEGGSLCRDALYQQRGYSDESINLYLKSLNEINFITLDSYPSITIFKKE